MTLGFIVVKGWANCKGSHRCKGLGFKFPTHNKSEYAQPLLLRYGTRGKEGGVGLVRYQKLKIKNGISLYYIYYHYFVTIVIALVTNKDFGSKAVLIKPTYSNWKKESYVSAVDQ